MVRHDDEHEDDAIAEEPEFVDWEHNQELVKKILGVLKAMNVHEALLTLVATCDVLARHSHRDWETMKVKTILNDL